jgi:hypothetical protein
MASFVKMLLGVNQRYFPSLVDCGRSHFIELSTAQDDAMPQVLKSGWQT